MPQPLAIWNSARGVWEQPQTENLLCEHSAVYSETWPTSGAMTSDGQVYELPTSAHHMDDSASSSLLLGTPRTSSKNGPSESEIEDGDPKHRLETQVEILRRGALLPTPDAYERGGSQHPAKRAAGGHSITLQDVAEHTLLPTPRATDGTNGGPNQRGSSGDLMLPSAVHHLLPTPAVNDMGEGKTPEDWDAWTAKMQAAHANGNGHGKSLAIEAQRLLPTPRAAADRASRASLTREGHWSAPSLAQALEMAQGILPREYDSWDEVQGWNGELTNPQSGVGNESLDE